MNDVSLISDVPNLSLIPETRTTRTTLANDIEKLKLLQSANPPKPIKKRRVALMAKISAKIARDEDIPETDEDLRLYASQQIEVVDIKDDGDDGIKIPKSKEPKLIAGAKAVCEAYKISTRTVETPEIMRLKNAALSKQVKYYARRLLATQRRNMALTSTIDMVNRSFSFEKNDPKLFRGVDLQEMIKSVLAGGNLAHGWVRMGDYFALYKEYNLLVREYERTCAKFFLKPKSFKKYI